MTGEAVHVDQRARIRDRLARRGDQFVERRHVQSGGELSEDPTVRRGQFHQDIHLIRLLSPG
jgi:hypothetical protein